MSKKTALIIIVTIVLLASAGFLIFYFYINQGQGTGIGTTGDRSNIFPETPGGNATPSGQTSEGDSETPIGTAGNETQTALTLKELSKRPSAGAVTLATSSVQGVTVRFMERSTGNVYDVQTDTSVESRASNTTIPKIQEALWNKDGTKVIARYIGESRDLIKTYSGILTKSPDQGEGSIQGVYFADNIQSIATNPDQNKIFYMLKHSEGSTGIISDFDGAKKNQLFDSPLQEFIPNWPTNSTITLTTRSASGMPGFLFLLNVKTGELSEAVSNVFGLTTLVNPDGTKVLYSDIGPKGFYLRVYPFKGGSAIDTVVSTFPEKCVWSKIKIDIVYCSVPEFLPDSNSLDNWYKGLTYFSDEIWKIDTETGMGELVRKLSDTETGGIDGTSLMLSPKEDYLIFTNKKDYHLWSLRLVP